MLNESTLLDGNNLVELAKYYELPAHLVTSMAYYIVQGRPLGDFLRACVSNDFKEACGRADSRNIHVLKEIAIFIVQEMPYPCQGSAAKYDAWLVHKAQERESAL